MIKCNVSVCGTVSKAAVVRPDFVTQKIRIL